MICVLDIYYFSLRIKFFPSLILKSLYPSVDYVYFVHKLFQIGELNLCLLEIVVLKFPSGFSRDVAFFFLLITIFFSRLDLSKLLSHHLSVPLVRKETLGTSWCSQLLGPP